MGNLLTMALVGVILASVVNLFLRSEMLMWIVTYVGILLFVGLTAYDTQTIKRMIYSGAEVDEPMQKMARWVRCRSTSISSTCFSTCCGCWATAGRETT